MHSGLTFLAIVSAFSGALLIISALLGISYYGISAQAEAAIAVIVFVIAILAAWILYKGLQANKTKVKTGLEALIGARGITVTDLKPNGEIRVLGEFWQAIAKDTWINAGEKVEVTAMEGMFLLVKSAEEKLNSSSH